MDLLQRGSMSQEELDVPYGPLQGQWQSLLTGGQVLTALILSTSFSEKYKGRNMYPGANDTAEVRLPTASSESRSTRPRLLSRSGNKEAVAYIWLGDEDRTLYVAFSPMRYRTQFLKIWCAGVVQDHEAHPLTVYTPGSECSPVAAHKKRPLPISSYVHFKMKRMWGQQGLWKKLTAAVDEYPGYRVVFAGISHGAALAQAAALQFRLHEREAQIFAISWNAYRWTNEEGCKIVKEELGDRLLAFVLSRRGEGPHATRYWDTVTGFPAGYISLHNQVLLDADTGHLLEHTAPHTVSTFGAVALMRMFELHFAKAAIAATKKTMALAVGSSALGVEESELFGKPLAEKFQEKVLQKGDRMVQAKERVRRATSTELNHARQRISAAAEDMRTRARRPGLCSMREEGDHEQDHEQEQSKEQQDQLSQNGKRSTKGGKRGRRRPPCWGCLAWCQRA